MLFRSGYLKTDMPWYERVVCCVGGLMLIFPGVTTDVIGVAMVALVFVMQLAAAKKSGTLPNPAE